MTRQKYPYYEWEDYRAGLYGLTWIGTMIEAAALLAAPLALESAMRRAVQEWPKAAAHHLTDGGMNQRAWLGWAACGITKQVPAHLTRAAWWTLNESQRTAANAAADAVIATYGYGHVQTLPF
jgi:hypothetical protein